MKAAMKSSPSRRLFALVTATAAFAVTGCHHNMQVAYYQPPPATYPYHRAEPSRERPAEPAETRNAEIPRQPRSESDDTYGRPILTETGLASWYGTVYNHHAAADGSVFDKNEMTAAQRTLPLGTTVRVTNLATGQQVLVRITDRGPFVPGRVLDLSMGAAKAIGLYREGVGRVRIEAYAHATSDPAGKWCVQTGAFKSKHDATELQEKLQRRYPAARVLEFAGPTGYWVRINPSLRSRSEASEIADWIGEPDPSTLPYLVRLD
jgi:rare lipoprotein A